MAEIAGIRTLVNIAPKSLCVSHGFAASATIHLTNETATNVLRFSQVARLIQILVEQILVERTDVHVRSPYRAE